MRRVMPKRSTWRVMQFETLRLRLIKIAARAVELKTQLKIHLPSSAPDQAICAVLLARHRALSPESWAFAPKSRPLPFNLQRLPNPEPTNPPQRQRPPMPAATASSCIDRVSRPASVLPRMSAVGADAV